MKALLRRIRELLKNRRFRQIWHRGVSTIAAIVVFITTYALVLPAITLEATANCGIQEHTHDEGCYISVLACGLEESDGHQHDDSCYTVENVLTCRVEEHEHTVENGCYDQEGRLVCTRPEHVHSADAGCYKEVKTLICEIPESEGHHHDSSCYKKELTCGKDYHVHSPACYSDDAASLASTQFAGVAATESAAVAASTAAAATVDGTDPVNGPDMSSTGTITGTSAEMAPGDGTDVTAADTGTTDVVNADNSGATTMNDSGASTANDSSDATINNINTSGASTADNSSDAGLDDSDPSSTDNND